MKTLEKSLIPFNGSVSARDFYRQQVEIPAFGNLARWHWENVTALDISGKENGFSPQLIERGVDKENIRRITPNFYGRLSKRELASVPDQSVDLITANGVFNRMNERALKYSVGRLGEVLKTGGQLFFVGPNPELRQWLPKGFSRLLHNYVDIIREAGEDAGLSYVETTSLLAPKYNPDPNAEVSYWPYGTEPMRVAGLMVKTVVNEDRAPYDIPLLEAGPELAIGMPYQKLLSA